MSEIHSFDPVVDAGCRTLVLGSIPGTESLRKRQYYGHAQNAFWRLMSALLGEPLYEEYGERLAMLLRHRIALWDVVKSCDRQGSLDAHIRNAAVNDFSAFFAAYPRITRVFFNGSAAYTMFARFVGFDISGVTFERLGSTSPAHAIPFEKRLANWNRVLQ